MGNSPSSTSTEPLAQGKHRNLSTISLPPTIPRRHNVKDAERKEIFPISDEGAPPPPPFPGRRGSIGFFRGKRAKAPVALDHTQLFKNLQSLQDLQNHDMNQCSWQTCQYLSDSNNNSNLNSLSTTPTTATTTPALTTAVTPTTPCPPQYLQFQNNNNNNNHHHILPHGHLQPRSPQPTSPVAASIQDYHPRQEQKLATFMKRNLLPPHALSTPVTLPTPISCESSNSSVSSSPVDCCSNVTTTTPTMASSAPEHNQLPQQYQRDPLHHSRRWAGEQEWLDDIPEGLEHDGGPWDVMDRQVTMIPFYTAEHHIIRALFKGQNYSAPLDFSKRELQQGQQQACDHSEAQIEFDAKDNTEVVAHSYQRKDDLLNLFDDDSLKQSESSLDTKPITTKAPISSSSFSSLATLNPHTPIPSKGNERSLVILSVGCGNSQWATEMARAHPQSAVHAINVSQIHSLPTVPETPPSFDLDNLFFYNLDENSLRVPFVSNSVDYIHVRRFLPNVNKTKYLAFLRELVRVLKVDGYMELVELDLRLRDPGVDSCWPSYWTLIGFDKLGIDTSLALNLGGIMRTMSGMDVIHKSSVNMPIGIHGGRIGLAAELLNWRFALTVRPWLMRQAMLSGSEFDELLERARHETRTLKSYQVCHVAVARKTATACLDF
ncbi:hypothetical protein BGZ79_010960 [Entomortierella chlamydospora]|nr:hypothetical protein BGZ79_010960 [Entomortierella chlamydospora]